MFRGHYFPTPTFVKLLMTVLLLSLLAYDLMILQRAQLVLYDATNRVRDIALRVKPDQVTIQPVEPRERKYQPEIWQRKACQVYWKEQFRNFTLYRNIITNDRIDYMHNISIITQVTTNRISSLMRLYENWREALTAVVYMEKEELNETFLVLNNWLHSMSNHLLTVHFVIKNGELFPQNVLANIAQESARAHYVLYIDSDLVPSKGLHPAIMKAVNNGLFTNGNKKVLVIPAFEVANETEIPRCKAEVINKYNISVNRFSFGLGKHLSDFGDHTMTDHWLTTSDFYKVQYHFMYEPFLVIHKNDSPDYAAYFQDRWRVKVSHVHNINERCFEFWVLPNGFLVHVNHERIITPESRANVICMRSLYTHEFTPHLERERQKYCSVQNSEYFLK